MNDVKRSQLREIITTIQSCADRISLIKREELSCMDTIVESVFTADRYLSMEEAVSYLEDAEEALEEAVVNMESAVSQ